MEFWTTKKVIVTGGAGFLGSQSSQNCANEDVETLWCREAASTT